MPDDILRCAGNQRAVHAHTAARARLAGCTINAGQAAADAITARDPLTSVSVDTRCKIEGNVRCYSGASVAGAATGGVQHGPARPQGFNVDQVDAVPALGNFAARAFRHAQRAIELANAQGLGVMRMRVQEQGQRQDER